MSLRQVAYYLAQLAGVFPNPFDVQAQFGSPTVTRASIPVFPDGFEVEAEFGTFTYAIGEAPLLIGVGILLVDVQPEEPQLIGVGVLLATVDQIFDTEDDHVQPVDSEVVWVDA